MQASPAQFRPHAQPRLLLIEDQSELLREMIDSLERPCCSSEVMVPEHGDPHERRVCRCVGRGVDQICCAVSGSLRSLHQYPLEAVDVVICASTLRDGSGLDALAYIRGLRPDLPVILTGEPSDTPLAIEAIRAGAADFLVTTGGDLRTIPLAVEKCLTHQRIRKENERLHDDLSESLAETAVKNRQLEALIQQLEIMARTDELTGLYNRRWLNLMLERVWADHANEGSEQLAFVMIDLDGFKMINDDLGHQRGDAVLRLAARLVDESCRRTDFAARYGGDEFCVLLPTIRPEEAALLAHRILDGFTREIAQQSDLAPRLSMSIGLAHLKLSRPGTPDQFISHADEAMYAAKAAGKNGIMVRHVEDCVPVGEKGLVPAEYLEAGERSAGRPIPEELYRRALDMARSISR